MQICRQRTLIPFESFTDYNQCALAVIIDQDALVLIESTMLSLRNCAESPTSNGAELKFTSSRHIVLRASIVYDWVFQALDTFVRKPFVCLVGNRRLASHVGSLRFYEVFILP
jgi:hypothetical protein